MTASAGNPVFYDPVTDSMYVTIRPGTGSGCSVDDARDLVIDFDDAGNVIGYDIQFASRHPDVVAEALALVHGRALAA